MKHVSRFSGGVGSWAASKRVADRHGADDLLLLFAETYMEDEDAYRFIVEAAADVFGVLTKSVRRLAGEALSITPIEADNLPRRKREINCLMSRLAGIVPQFVRVVDGRTPWEVFDDERYLGNSRVDPCSKKLKRQLLDRWTGSNCEPAGSTHYVGLDWSEKHRFEGRGDKPGLRKRMAEAGWRFEAPMCEAPFLTKGGMLGLLAASFIRRPRLYELGFAHNNCGGACCKGGQGQWLLLNRVMPARFAYHRQKEAALIESLGGDVAMLKDRRGGESRPLPLSELEDRQHTDCMTLDYDDMGGCGCAIDDLEAA